MHMSKHCYNVTLLCRAMAVCLSLMSGRIGVTLCSLVLGVMLDYACTAAICLLSGTVLGECHNYLTMFVAMRVLPPTVPSYSAACWIIRVFSVVQVLHKLLKVKNKCRNILSLMLLDIQKSISLF
jgi:hypothetical protein